MSGREGHDAMALQREYVMQLLGSVTGTLEDTHDADASHENDLGGDGDVDEWHPTVDDMERMRDLGFRDSEERDTAVMSADPSNVGRADSEKKVSKKTPKSSDSEDNESSSAASSDDTDSEMETEKTDVNWPSEQQLIDSTYGDRLNTSLYGQSQQQNKVNKTKHPKVSEGMEEMLRRAREFSCQRVPITGEMFTDVVNEDTAIENNAIHTNTSTPTHTNATSTHANATSTHANATSTHANATSTHAYAKSTYNNTEQEQVVTERVVSYNEQSPAVSATHKKRRLSSSKSNSNVPSRCAAPVRMTESISCASAEVNSVSGIQSRDVIVQDSSTFNLSQPRLLVDYRKHFTGSNNYTKGCKWSPDGELLLTLTADQHFRLWPLPALATTFTRDVGGLDDCPEPHRPALTVPEGELVYDYQWYPLMSPDDPTSQTFVCCCRGLPVHMWDANTGELVCSYRPFNHLDELAPTSSLGFSRDGCQLVCGFNKCIRIFNTNRPGRQCTTICGKRQNGIISCFDFHPHLHTALVAGSYLGSVGLYSTNSNKLCSLLEGHTGGITQLTFSSDGYRLYTGARKDCELLCWDIRQLGRVLSSHTRTVDTHQRVAFALSSDDATLITGSTDGVVSSWRVGTSSPSPDPSPAAPQCFTAHDDCANGVSLHPRYPVLATSSGQRRRPPHPDDAPNGDRDELTIPRRSTVKLWWLGA